VRTYLAVLRLPGVASAMGTSVLARLPIGALGLVLILRVRELGGSYAAAGVVAGAFMLASGITSPLLGRLIDRLGQTRVVVVGGAISGGAIAGLAALGHGSPLIVFVGLSGLAGLTMPPLGGCVRVLLGELVSEPAERHAAFALESSALEVVFLIGPLAIVGGIAAASPQLALAVCAALLIGGTLAFAAAPASRRWRPSPGEGPRSLAGPMRDGGVRMLVLTFGLVGTSFGAIEVATAAFAQHHGAPHAVGPLLALWGFASLLGGVLVGRFGPADVPARRIAVLLAALFGADLLLFAAPSPALLAIGLVAAGGPIAPLGAQIYSLITTIAPAGTVTESTTWLGTGIGGGVSAGSALGGVLIGAGGARAAYALGAVAILGALVAVRGSVERLRPVAVPA
jgi:MFS family permease